MSIAHGYVHISVRNAQKVSRSQVTPNGHHLPARSPQPLRPSYDNPSAGYGVPAPEQDHFARPLTAPTAVVAGSDYGLRNVGADNVAHGFVLYLGVDHHIHALRASEDGTITHS